LRDEKDAVLAAAAAYSTTAASIEEWTNELANRQDTFDQHVDSIRDMIVAYGDLQSLGKRTNVFGDEIEATATSIIEDLRGRVGDAQRFMELIAQLTNEGMNPAAIQQLLTMGVENGLGIAEAIAEGGPGAVQEISALFSQLDAIGTQLGIQTGNLFYGNGIQAAKDMITGLTTQLGIDADNVTTAMGNLGVAAGEAIHRGLKSKESDLNAAVRELAKGMEDELRTEWGLQARHSRTTGGSPSGGGGGGGSWPGGPNIQQEITIWTQQIDPQKTAADLGWELAQRTGF
jgi:hypothetical protein